jgi:hypothetical protein
MTSEESEFWREESSDSRLEILIFLCQIALIMAVAIFIRPLERLFVKLKKG